MTAKGSSVSLTFRLIGVVILSVIVSICLVTISTTDTLKKDVANLLENQQQVTATYIAAEIDTKVAQRIRVLELTARSAAEHFSSSDQLVNFLSSRITMPEFFPGGLVALDKQGMSIATYPVIGGGPKSLRDRDYFQLAIASGKTIIGKPRIGQISRNPLVSFASPVRGASGEILGVLAGFIPLSDKGLFGHIEQGIREKGGTIIVGDPRNDLIVSSNNPNYILQPLSELGSALQQFTNQTGTAAIAGSNMLVAARPIPKADWVVQIMLPTEEAFLPVTQMQNNAYMIAAVLTFFLILGVWFFVKRALKPLGDVMASIHQMVANKAVLRPLSVSSYKEIQDLATSFNLLAEQRMKSDEELRQSEQRLRRAELASGSGNWELHLDTQTIFASAGAINIYGLNAEQYHFSDIKKAALPEYRALLDAAMQDLIEQGKPYDVEFRIHVTNTGELRDIHSVAFYEKEKRIVFVVIQDVTERRRILKALEQGELRRRLFLEQTRDGVALLRQDGSLVEWNPAFAAMLGYSEEEMGRLNVKDWDIKLSKQEIDEITRHLGLNHMSLETVHQRKDGSQYEVEISISGVELNDQNYLFCLHRDITSRKLAERNLRSSEARFRALIDSSPIPYAVNDETFHVTYLNAAFINTFGYTLEDIPVLDAWWAKAYPDPEYRRHITEVWSQHMTAAEQENRPFEPVEADICCKNGEQKTVLVSAEPLNDTLYGLHVISFVDITSRKKAEESRRLAAAVFSCAREGIVVTDANGVILDVNPMFSEVTGYSHDECVGQSLRILKSGRHDLLFYEDMWRSLKNKYQWHGEIWNRRKNGEIYPEMLTISAVRGTDGKIRQYVGLFSDITELKKYELQLEKLAHYDPLTGLPNRALLSDRLQLAMAQSIRRKLHIAICYLDLDGFKQVNDQYGHHTGDQLLIALTQRMSQMLREADTLARIGGDEFVAILPDLSDFNASLVIAERLINEVSRPVQLGDLVIQVSVSIGITFYPQDAVISADQLLRQADHAMYEAKSAGKNCYCVFEDLTPLVASAPV